MNKVKSPTRPKTPPKKAKKAVDKKKLKQYCEAISILDKAAEDANSGNIPREVIVENEKSKVLSVLIYLVLIVISTFILGYFLFQAGIMIGRNRQAIDDDALIKAYCLPNSTTPGFELKRVPQSEFEIIEVETT